MECKAQWKRPNREINTEICLSGLLYEMKKSTMLFLMSQTLKFREEKYDAKQTNNGYKQKGKQLSDTVRLPPGLYMPSTTEALQGLRW